MATTTLTLTAEGDNYSVFFRAVNEQHSLQVFTTGTVHLETSMEPDNFVVVQDSEMEVAGSDTYQLSGLAVGLYIKVVSDAAGTVGVTPSLSSFTMTYAQIVAIVKAFMDEAGSIDGGLVVDTDTEKPIDLLISSMLSPSWRSFAILCPLHLLPTETVTGAAGADKVIIVQKPTGFIRLHSLKALSWAREANEPIPATGNAYAAQKNAFTRGMPTRPVVVVKEDSIEGYTASEASEAFTLKYVDSILFDPDYEDAILPENISHAFCYHVAGKVYDSLGNKMSQVMFSNRDQLLM